MAGLRERKKEQTRRRIADAALELFAARGYDAVTVNEIAAAADVAKATLFAYFPSKESLVLEHVGEDDLAGVVAARPAGQAPLDALRAYARGMAARAADTVDASVLVTQVQVIMGSPALLAGADARHERQRRDLAAALSEAMAAETGPHAGTRTVTAGAGGAAPIGAALMASLVTASMRTLQEAFFQRLAAGAALADVAARLADDVEVAFDLLEHGMGRAVGDRAELA